VLDGESDSAADDGDNGNDTKNNKHNLEDVLRILLTRKRDLRLPHSVLEAFSLLAC
jgi:hypothetical protein